MGAAPGALVTGSLTPVDELTGPAPELVTSLPPQKLHGLVDLSVKAHDNTPIEVTQPNPPGWHGMPVTPAYIRWRLMLGAQPVVPTGSFESRWSAMR